MKVNCVSKGVYITPNQTNFRSQNPMPANNTEHDKFVASQKKNKNRTLQIIGGSVLIGIGLFLLSKIKHKPSKDALIFPEFKNVNDAKEYFEKLGIETDFRGATKEHLPMLERIKNNLKQLKEMGVKKDKPNSITVSDWKNRTELEELQRAKGVTSDVYEPNYFAQCLSTENNNKSHIFINSSKPDFDMFRHEMGHVNDFNHDSIWNSKGFIGYDFADKQLQILGNGEKIYRSAGKFNNIFYFQPSKNTTSFTFPNENMETRYVHAKKMISKMQEETNCYAPELLHEQKAYIFEGLLKGDKFSDEVMLYYDFAGGARIPNLKIDGKSYDEYIESLYNNKDLVEKLKENIKISKL